MKKRWKTCVALTLAGVMTACIPASAFVPYDSYTYSTAKGSPNVVYSPAPYLPESYIDSISLGVDLSKPVDMCFDQSGRLLIMDSGLNALVILKADLTLERVVSAFSSSEGEVTLSNPQGMFMAEDGSLYICDTDNARILLLDQELKVTRIYEAPQSEILGEDYRYRPRKLAVDSSGTMYVVNSNEYNGLIKLNSEGKFITFMGSNKAIVDLAEMFWKKLLSKEQTDKMVSFLPIEYVNLSLDDSGFLYTVAASSAEKTPIKRLNLSGDDVLNRAGYVDIIGDIYEVKEGTSIFTDIVGSADGVYYALDSAMGRIFVYNREGYLFYAFGGKGEQIGNYSLPSAIEVKGDRLFVLDELKASLTVLEKTDYAKAIAEADSLYNAGRYGESLERWNEVLKLNSNFELAYAQIGKIFLREKRYREAMEYFELGNYRGDDVTLTTGYNKAFSEYRKEWASRYLGVAVIAVAAVCGGWVLFRRIRRKRKGGRK